LASSAYCLAAASRRARAAPSCSRSAAVGALAASACAKAGPAMPAAKASARRARRGGLRVVMRVSPGGCGSIDAGEPGVALALRGKQALGTGEARGLAQRVHACVPQRFALLVGERG